MQTCEEYLQEDVNLSGGEIEIPSTPVSAFDDPLEIISATLLDTQRRLDAALKQNIELSFQISCLKLENLIFRKMLGVDVVNDEIARN